MQKIQTTKKLHLVSWIILVIGIAFKFLHWPGGSLLAIIGCLLMLVYSLIYLVKNSNRDIAKSFFNLTSTFVTIYLLFRIQYWAFAQVVFGLTFILGVTTLILSLVKQTQFKLKQILLTGYFICFLAISFVHADMIFYLFNKSYIEYQNEDGDYYNYRVLDRYSWFLYLAGKFDEASKINQDAIISAKNYIEFAPYDTEAKMILENIEKHGEQIKNKSWTELK